jgi:AmpD protein
MPALSIAMGLLSGARAVESPNRDARPGNLDPVLIVVHGISLPPGRYGGPWIERLFMNTLPADEDPLFRDHPAPARFVARADCARRRTHAVRAV